MVFMEQWMQQSIPNLSTSSNFQLPCCLNLPCPLLHAAVNAAEFSELSNPIANHIITERFKIFFSINNSDLFWFLCLWESNIKSFILIACLRMWFWIWINFFMTLVARNFGNNFFCQNSSWRKKYESIALEIQT